MLWTSLRYCLSSFDILDLDVDKKNRVTAKMGIFSFFVTLILALSCTNGLKTVDEIIREAYENSTAVQDADTVLVEMDMLYTKDDYDAMMSGSDSMKGIRGERFRWTNKVVPYVIDTTQFNAQQQAIIRRGMDEWEKYTCIRIRPWRGEANYVRVSDNNSGCNSYVGMRNWGMQPMNLNKNGCVYHHTVVHEFGHAIGFEHEHQRPERDNFITIQWANVGTQWRFAFDKYPADRIDNKGVTYDYRSVMHYGKTAFTSNRGVTIRTNDPSYQDVIGRSPGLAFSDIKMANLLYRCDEQCVRKPSCPAGGFVGKDCKCWCDSGSWETRYCECGTRGCRGGNPSCSDNNNQCSYWASIGECQKNPNYMLVNCKKSCGVC